MPITNKGRAKPTKTEGRYEQVRVCSSENCVRFKEGKMPGCPWCKWEMRWKPGARDGR